MTNTDGNPISYIMSLCLALPERNVSTSNILSQLGKNLESGRFSDDISQGMYLFAMQIVLASHGDNDMLVDEVKKIAYGDIEG